MVNEELIVKYLAGEAEEHEVALLKEWRTNAENEKQFKQLETLWNSSANLADTRVFDTDKAWQKVAERTSSQTKSKSVPIRRVWLAAASLVLLFTVSLVLMTVLKQDERMLSGIANKTQIDLHLSDGTDIILKNGRLEYPEAFSGKKRQVLLKDGKAFFKVAHNSEQPFEITAENTSITVLGTEFEVSTEPNSTTVRVHSGKVKFISPAGERILTAGKSAVYDKRQNKMNDLDIKADNSLSYATHILDFKNKALADVVADLNAYFNDREIILDSALADCRLTATFEKEKLENVLEVIRVTMNVQVRWDRAGNCYRIEGRACQP